MDSRFNKIAARLAMHQQDIEYDKGGAIRWLEVVDTVRAVSIQVREYDADVGKMLEITGEYPPMACAFGYIFLKRHYPDTEIRSFEKEGDFVMLSGEESTLP